ncbi:MAG: hypothetical protein JKY67_20775 [Pseudomonadales bacterium]|nr:hypothetical protein [Pseudomonadales bacterium]
MSGTTSAADSPDGDFPANANSEMTLRRSIDLTGTVFPVLTFWHKIGVYSDDHGFLEVSEDGGFTWDVLLDYTSTLQSTWSNVPVDLRAYRTVPIKIRFRVRTSVRDQIWGWDVDDVEIKEN